jgi:hypothetical protein
MGHAAAADLVARTPRIIHRQNEARMRRQGTPRGRGKKGALYATKQMKGIDDAG